MLDLKIGIFKIEVESKMNITLEKYTLRFIISIYLMIAPSLFAFDVDPVGKNIKEGVERYKSQDFQGSLESFNQAEMESKEDDRILFNKGTSYFKLNDYKLALKYFEKTALSENKDLKLRSQYNKGNTYAKLGDKKNAIKSYMEALQTDPNFLPARKNIELLTKKEDKNKEESKNENSESEDKKENSNDDKSSSENNQNNPQNHQKPKPNSEKEKQMKETKQPITKEEAERILESAKQNKINRKKMNERRQERNEVFW